MLYGRRVRLNRQAMPAGLWRTAWCAVARGCARSWTSCSVACQVYIAPRQALREKFLGESLLIQCNAEEGPPESRRADSGGARSERNEASRPMRQQCRLAVVLQLAADSFGDASSSPFGNRW